MLKAYGFSADNDILAKLLELSLELAEREKQGEQLLGRDRPAIHNLDGHSTFQQAMLDFAVVSTPRKQIV